MKYFYTAILGTLGSVQLLFSEPIAIPESQSPNGKYAFRMIANQLNGITSLSGDIALGELLT